MQKCIHAVTSSTLAWAGNIYDESNIFMVNGTAGQCGDSVVNCLFIFL